METIVVAIITGGLSLLGVIITSNKTTRDVQAKMDKHMRGMAPDSVKKWNLAIVRNSSLPNPTKREASP